MYNLAIRKCTSPPLLAPRLKIFKWKFVTPLGIQTPDLLNRRQTCYHLSQRGELSYKCKLIGVKYIILLTKAIHCLYLKLCEYKLWFCLFLCLRIACMCLMLSHWTSHALASMQCWQMVLVWSIFDSGTSADHIMWGCVSIFVYWG